MGAEFEEVRVQLDDSESSLLMFAIGAAAGACTRADEQDLVNQMVRLFKKVAGIETIPDATPEALVTDPLEPPTPPEAPTAKKATKKAIRGQKG